MTEFATIELADGRAFPTSATSDIQSLLLAVEQGVDLSRQDINGWSAAHFAARDGLDDSLRFLDERGIDILGPRSNFGVTPLMLASHLGPMACLKLLVDRGADVNARCHQDETACWRAARQGRLEVLVYLAAQGANLSVTNPQGHGLVAIAAAAGSMDCLRWLADQGADLRQNTERGLDACAMAASNGQADALDFLLSRGMDPDVASHLGAITHPIRAAGVGSVACLEVLARHGADFSSPANRDLGYFAARSGELDCLAFLDAAGVDLDLKTADGQSAASWAQARGNLEMLALLNASRERRQLQGATLSTSSPAKAARL
jgi:ankyrin repeat protein